MAGQVVHRHVLYLGEVNDRQRASWERAVDVVDENTGTVRQLELLPADRPLSAGEVDAVQVRLSAMSLERPRQWGACWLADTLWRQLHLDTFFGERLGCSREGTEWEKVLRVLVVYRLLSPGSEWRLHRQWFGTTALPDLLGVDERAAQPATPLPLPRSAAAAEGGVVRSSAPALERSVRRPLRGAALRSDEHLLRVRRAGERNRSAALRLQPRSAQRLRAGGHCAGRHARRVCRSPTRCCRATPPTRPRCVTMMAAGPNASRPGRANLGDGPRRPDRGGARRRCARALRRCAIWSARPKARLNRLEAALAERPWLEVRASVAGQTACPRTAKSTSSRRVRRAWTRSVRCAAARSRNTGNDSVNSRVCERPQRDELLLKLGKAAGRGPGRGAAGARGGVAGRGAHVSAR